MTHPRPATLGQLKETGYKPTSDKDELRRNVIRKLKDHDFSKHFDKKGEKHGEDGGKTVSKLSQSSDSGENQSKVWADTTAYQENWSKIDQSSNQIAGIGGDGGNDNYAKGGDVAFALVHTNPSTEIDYTELKDVLNHSDHVDFGDLLHG